MPKYYNDKNAILSNDLYFDVFEKKGVKFLRIRRTQDFLKLKGLEIAIAGEKIWSYGDTLFKLSYEYYGTYDFWWCIALVNNKPTDAHYSIGDIVLVPQSPQTIAESMR